MKLCMWARFNFITETRASTALQRCELTHANVSLSLLAGSFFHISELVCSADGLHREQSPESVCAKPLDSRPQVSADGGVWVFAGVRARSTDWG
jgi:hypothetical protein